MAATLVVLVLRQPPAGTSSAAEPNRVMTVTEPTPVLVDATADRIGLFVFNHGPDPVELVHQSTGAHLAEVEPLQPWWLLGAHHGPVGVQLRQTAGAGS